MRTTRKSNLISILLIVTLAIALVMVVIFGSIKQKKEQAQLKAKTAMYNKITQEENKRAIEVKKEKAERTFIEKCQSGTAKYAILGDSITDAGNVTKGITGGASIPSKGYASLLKDKLVEKYGDGIIFGNRGTGGQTVAQATEKVATEIIPNKYDLVVIQLGTSDWNSGTSLEKFETDYRKLVDLLTSKTNAEIACTSMGWLNNWNGLSSFFRETEYNKIIQKISVEHGLKYIDTYTAMKNSGKDWSAITLTSDPVHPNDEGHIIWSNEIFKTLTKNN